MVVVERADQPEIAADRPDGMKIGLHAHAAPDQRLRRQTLLHASRQRQVLLDFALTLFEFVVGVAEFCLRLLLLGNIRERDDPVEASIRVFDAPRADNDRNPAAVLPGQNEFETVVAVAYTPLA